MKIGIVTQHFRRTDGQGRINYEVAYELARRGGHDVTLISMQVTMPLKDTPGVVWHPVTIPAWVRGSLLRFQMFALAAGRVLRSLDHRADRRLDLVQVNGFNVYYRAADVNVAMFVHTDWFRSRFRPRFKWRGGARALYRTAYTWLNAWLEKGAFRNARRVVALSPLVADSLVRDIGIARDRIIVIPPGVDTEEFRPLRPGEPNALRARCDLPDDAFALFFTGDIATNRKNLDLVLDTLAALEPTFHLAVAGRADGSPYPARARALGIAPRVHFLGHCDDVATLLRGADAFVFPSHYDTFGLVVTEAMASGVPVITAPSVGAASVITPGRDGLVLRSSDDQDGLKAALRRLARDRHEAGRISRAARATAETLTWEAMARRYEALYQEVIAEKKTKKNAGAEAAATAPPRYARPGR